MSKNQSIRKGFFLYKYFIGDRLVYIGKTVNPYGRYKGHCSESSSYEAIDRVEIAACESQEAIDILELYYISKLKPEWNKSGKDDRWLSSPLENDLIFTSYSMKEFETVYSLPVLDGVQLKKFYSICNAPTKKVIGASTLYNMFVNNEFVIRDASSIVVLDVNNLTTTEHKWYELDTFKRLSESSLLKYQPLECTNRDVSEASNLIKTILLYISHSRNASYTERNVICKLTNTQRRLVENGFNITVGIATLNQEIFAPIIFDINIDKDNTLEAKISPSVLILGQLTSFFGYFIESKIFDFYNSNRILFAPLLLPVLKQKFLQSSNKIQSEVS